MTQAIALLLLFADPVPLRQVFDGAVASLSRGDLEAAERGFQRVLQVQPGNIGAMGNLGVVYSRQERFDKAAEMYRAALRAAPTDPGLLLNLGLALLKQERFAEAREPLEKVVRAHPSHQQAVELLATARLQTGDATAAAASLESLDPTPGVLFQLGLARLKLGQRTEAAAAFDKMEQAMPADQAAYLRGKALYESGLFEEAARELEKASAFEGRRELAKVFVSLRRNEEAEALLRKLLAERADDRESAYFLGAMLVERGGTAEGIKLLAKANPGFWGTHYYLGKAAAKSDPKAAALRFQKADELRPGDTNILYQLMRAHQAAGNAAAASAAAAKLKAAREKQRQDEQSAVAK